VTLTPEDAFIAVRELTGLAAAKTAESATVRKKFGDRLPTAQKQECERRERDVQAIDNTVAFINASI
jgi:nucleoside diphosphate kinase